MTNCSDGGVAGPVVGVIGSLQALETVKILSGLGTSYSGTMMIFDGAEGRVRNIKLRGEGEQISSCDLVTAQQSNFIKKSLPKSDHSKIDDNKVEFKFNFNIEN